MCAMRPLENAEPLRLVVLHEETSKPVYDLPMGLWRRYGGDLRLDGPCLYANFVASVDGVVALETKHSPSVISQRSDADRFVMGLLRARADAVLIGGGTLRADPGHVWTADFIYPEAAADFAELRRSNEQPTQPRLVVVTGGGDLDPTQRALEDAIVVTTPSSREELRRRLPSTTVIRTLDRIVPESIAALLREEGFEVILSEAGPRLFGELVGAGCLDQVFLTISPVLAGSDVPERKTLSGGMALPPAGLQRMSLASARRHGSYLFLSYARSWERSSG